MVNALLENMSNRIQKPLTQLIIISNIYSLTYFKNHCERQYKNQEIGQNANCNHPFVIPRSIKLL